MKMRTKKMVLSRMFVTLGMVLLLLAAGCGQDSSGSASGSGSGSAKVAAGGPSLSLLKELVVAQNISEGEIPFDPEPINFHLKSGELNGPHYQAVVTYNQRFSVSYQEFANMIRQESSRDPMGALQAMTYFAMLEEGHGQFKKGQLISVEQVMTMSKVDNKWQLISIE